MITFSGLLFQPLWVPTLLVAPGGLTLAEAGFVVGMSNLGSVFGTALFGRFFDRFGLSRIMTIAYILAAGAFCFVGYSSSVSVWPATAAFVSCFFLGGASAGALSLAATIYPTSLRATGVGLAMAMARVAQVTSALLVGQMLGVGWGSSGIFVAAGIVVAVAAVPTILLGKAVHRKAGEA